MTHLKLNYARKFNENKKRRRIRKISTDDLRFKIKQVRQAGREAGSEERKKELVASINFDLLPFTNL